MDKEDVYIHNEINTLAIKKNKNLPFTATWVDLEGIMLSEMLDRKRQIQYNLHVESIKTQLEN